MDRRDFNKQGIGIDDLIDAVCFAIWRLSAHADVSVCDSVRPNGAEHCCD